MSDQPKITIPPQKIGSVTVRAKMLVEFTHESAWSNTETVKHLHEQALRELEVWINNNRDLARHVRIIKVVEVNSTVVAEPSERPSP